MTNKPIPDRPPDGLPDVSAAADHFELLGLPRRFELGDDEIKAAYRRLARRIHPDRFTNAPPEVAARATELSAAVNVAHRALSDPVRRTSYLLELVGGPGPEDVRDVPGNLLMDVMMLREQIEADKQAQDRESLARHAKAIEADRASALERVTSLAKRIEAADDREKKSLRMELNAIRYYDNLLAELALDPITRQTEG